MSDAGPREIVPKTHGVLPALAVALVVVGTATAAYAGWWLPADLARPRPPADGLRAWPIASAALAVVTGPLAWWVRRRTDGATPRLAALTLLGALTSGVLVWWAASGAVDQASKGFLGLVSTTATIGAVVALVGWLLATVALRGRGGRWPRGFGPVAVVVTGLVVAAGVGAAAYVVPGVGLTATTARVTAPLAVPGSVEGVVWRAAVPSGVRDVVAAGPGVVALVADGVVAVDGATGRVRWTHRRGGAVARSLGVTTDARTLVLRWSAGPDGRSQSVFLDARTGRSLPASGDRQRSDALDPGTGRVGSPLPGTDGWRATFGKRGAAGIRDASGEQIGRVEDSRCAGRRLAVVTREAISCLRITDVGAYRRDGRARLVVEDYAGARRGIDVDLGGPFAPGRGAAGREVVAAPGAWVVWVGDAVAPGGRSYLVGLG